MKRNSFIDLVFYKFNVFVTKEFCALSFLAIACVIILILYVFDVRIYTDWDNRICENFNLILNSVTSGYVTSYFMYFITVHIPNYAQRIVSDSIICDQLSSYKDKLLYSFGELIYILKKEGLENTIDIPEITRLFESEECKDKVMVYIIQSRCNIEHKKKLLINEFESLEDDFMKILSLNTSYKSIFSYEISQLQTSLWIKVLSLLRSEIQHSLDGFEILKRSYVLSLINQNFCLVNKAAKINTIINAKRLGLCDLYKLIFTSSR